MSALVIKLALSYLLGGLVGALLLGRLRGVDIRREGSGNAGATNAFRSQGPAFALAVVVIDIGKGVVAALVVARLTAFGPDILAPVATGLACGLAAALGHCYPPAFGFRGGKGAGSLFGAITVLFPWLALAMFAAWALVLTTTGYVGLGTVVAALLFPGLVLLAGADATTIWLAVAAALLIVWMHRANLIRLRAGTEPRFARARLFAPRSRRTD